MSIKHKTIVRSNRAYHKDKEFNESLPLVEGEKVIYDTYGYRGIMTTVSGTITKVVTHIHNATNSDKRGVEANCTELCKVIEVSVDDNCLENEKQETIDNVILDLK